MDAMQIRKNAKKELGEWFASLIKKTTSEAYRLFRKEGLRAVDALELARMIVQGMVNQEIKRNFYGRSPH